MDQPPHPQPTAPDLASRLAAFREAHPPLDLVVSGVHWRVYDAGDGPEALVVLPGGLRLGEPAFGIVEALAGDRRVIVPDYPPLQTIDALVEGLLGVLDALGLKRVDLMGSSLGGAIAQAFARKAPQRLDRLMLVSTFAPDPTRASTLRRDRRVLEWAPQWLLRRIMTGVYKSFTTPSPADKAFWDGYMKDAVAHRLRRADFVATLANVADFHANHHVAPGDLGALEARTLLIDSDDDPVVSIAERERLRSLYPRATAHRLSGAGHTTFISRPEAAIAVLRDYLQRSDSAQPREST